MDGFKKRKLVLHGYLVIYVILFEIISGIYHAKWAGKKSMQNALIIRD